ncbi:hypothetical protein QE320_gp017 [Pseudomonas phage EM]|uniref:Uncharacterized protein n=1 Tax=Pseudomonas phage EM TaxID=2936914 RepID=A0AAE9HIW3_9CAUD|nr:hypothetical protein QE320_gp017 [Pseudomonas phage EM]UPW35819.1 hypothetical protein EM_017 [Pseudomonas phage EM]
MTLFPAIVLGMMYILVTVTSYHAIYHMITDKLPNSVLRRDSKGITVWCIILGAVWPFTLTLCVIFEVCRVLRAVISAVLFPSWVSAAWKSKHHLKGLLQ